jgi:hypothetical protein
MNRIETQALTVVKVKLGLQENQLIYHDKGVDFEIIQDCKTRWIEAKRALGPYNIVLLDEAQAQQVAEKNAEVWVFKGPDLLEVVKAVDLVRGVCDFKKVHVRFCSYNCPGKSYGMTIEMQDKLRKAYIRGNPTQVSEINPIR